MSPRPGFFTLMAGRTELRICREEEKAGRAGSVIRLMFPMKTTFLSLAAAVSMSASLSGAEPMASAVETPEVMPVAGVVVTCVSSWRA